MTTTQTPQQTLDALLANRQTIADRRAQLEQDRDALGDAIDAAKAARGARIAAGDDASEGADELRTLTDRAEGATQALAVLDEQLARLAKPIAAAQGQVAQEAADAARDALREAQAELRAAVVDAADLVATLEQKVRNAGQNANMHAGLAARALGEPPLGVFAMPFQGLGEHRITEAVDALARFTRMSQADRGMLRATNPLLAERERQRAS